MSNAMLDGLDEVKVFENLPKLNPGAVYEVEVNNLALGRSFKTGNDYFRATVTVVKADGKDATPVGTTAQMLFVPSKKFPQYEQANMKRLCAAVSGVKPSEITAANVKYLVGDDQPAKGNVFKVGVSTTLDDDGALKTFDSGDPILKYEFGSVSAT